MMHAPLPARPQRADGKTALTVALKRGRSAIGTLYQQAPCRLLFPDIEPGEPLQAVLVNTSGGLVGGDRLEASFAIGESASATLTGQAAEKIYRSLGEDATVDTRLRAGEGAWLEWLPQETILFDGARLKRRLLAELHPAARLLAGEIVLFGRAARGEALTYGKLHDSWAIRVGGRLVWADAVRLDGDIKRQRERPFGFGTAAGYATLIHVGPNAASFLPLARELAAASPAEAGATLVGGILLLRFLGTDAASLRLSVGRAAMALRAAIAGLPARLPRIWQT